LFFYSFLLILHSHWLILFLCRISLLN
jgi:hypothetical protein